VHVSGFGWWLTLPAPLMIKARSRSYKRARERKGSQVSYSWWSWFQSGALAKSRLSGESPASRSSSCSSVLLGVPSSGVVLVGASIRKETTPQPGPNPPFYRPGERPTIDGFPRKEPSGKGKTKHSTQDKTTRARGPRIAWLSRILYSRRHM
jgi:hypothetical protein